jgi:competence protein ComEC
LIFGAFALAATVVAEAVPVPGPPPFVVWTMLDVNTGTLQADAHLLRMPDGTFQMIDAGDTEGTLLPQLRKEGVRRVERVFVSHMHKDHYGGLTAMVDAGIEVCEVFVNLPDRAVCEAEVPWGCDYPHIEETLATLEKKGVQIVRVRSGDLVYDKSGVRLQALYAFNGLDSPVGRTDVNDTSVVLALEYGKTRVLFTGDLNAALGAYLAAEARDLKADILKVPHHGTESVAPDELFDRVGPSVALVPSPKALWLSSRSERVRRYFQAHETRTYVNGLDGPVSVRIGTDGYEVTPSSPRGAPPGP